MLTVTLAAPPESGRPSDGATRAFGATKLARTSGPGMLWNDPLIWTSTRGIVYEASIFTCVRKFVSTRQ